MLFRLAIECDNAAFEAGNEGMEVARILRELADRVESRGDFEGCAFRLMDFNGNGVGYASTLDGDCLTGDFN